MTGTTPPAAPGARRATPGSGRAATPPSTPLAASTPIVARAPVRTETILLATDLSPASDAATGRAIDLAVRLEARLLVVHVVGGRGRSRSVEERAKRTTSAGFVVERARAAGADASFLIWDGDPGDGIVDAAEAETVDMIVVGSHARGSLGRYILGSVSDHVVHRAACPVLVVRPHDEDVV